MRKALFSTLFFVLFCGVSLGGYEELAGLSVGFCSGTSDTMIVSPGEKKEFCLSFTNVTKKDITIKFGFTEGTLTMEGTRACGPDSVDNPFAKLLLLEKNTIYTVPASGTLVKSFPFSIPGSVKGQQYGCLAYQTVSDEAKGAGGLFNIQIRKAINLAVFVKPKEGILRNNLDPKFSFMLNQSGNLILSFDVVNTSDFEQMLSFSGEVNNLLGFKKQFAQDLFLKVGESKQMVLDLGAVPSYKGLFSLDLHGYHQASLGTLVSDFPQFKDPVVFVYSDSTFAFSIVIFVVIGFLLLFLLLIVLLLRKKRVVVVQVASPQSPIVG